MLTFFNHHILGKALLFFLLFQYVFDVTYKVLKFILKRPQLTSCFHAQEDVFQ